MLKKLFLSCALALPVSMASHKDDMPSNITVLKFLINTYHCTNPTSNLESPIYAIGAQERFKKILLKAHIDVWNIVSFPSSKRDIIASPMAIPLKRESGVMVLFMVRASIDCWYSMRMFMEATYPIVKGGYLLFFPDVNPQFSRIARSYGWDKLPFTWFDMEIWQKKKIYYGKGIAQISS